MAGSKKKFIDKKKSATFQLLARDTSTLTIPTNPLLPTPHTTDRVFVRVDKNPYLLPDDLDESIFADAPFDVPSGSSPSKASAPILPDHVRREILELGLSDDGYNYLVHLREIRQEGGGASYFYNERARMDLVPVNVEAYDASRLRIAPCDGEEEAEVACKLASESVRVQVRRALDPDVARLLEDDGEVSKLGSDAEDLEEDFVAIANRDVEGSAKVAGRQAGVAGWLDEVEEETGDAGYEHIPGEEGEERQRTRRLLDAQFDLLALQEYDTGSDDEDAEFMEKGATEALAKLTDDLKDHSIHDLEFEDKYRVPADYIFQDQTSKLANSSTEVLQKCSEYAKMYINDDMEEKEVMLFQESSDESESWDCETIVSTYTNLDNHPGKIPAPEMFRKKIPEIIPRKDNIINLRGKDKIPLDFLPKNAKLSGEKVKAHGVLMPKKRPQDETKEAKKERKAAVKEVKREARRSKKDLKQLYRSEAQKAQQIAAISGPSSIHLM